MEQIFISSIHIKKIRHLEDVKINLSEKEKKHLILTGKNGCGKTSVLEAIKLNRIEISNDIEKYNGVISIRDYKPFVENEKFVIKFNYPFDNLINRLVKIHKWFFTANRFLKVNKSEGVRDEISDNVEDFEKFLAKKRTEQAFMSFEKSNQKEVKTISDWFDQLEKSLKLLFEDDTLELVTNRKEDKVNFVLKSKFREDFDFNTLSSGYSSILSILFDMMQKMQNEGGSFDYTKQGFAIIDEVEAHLHVSLQKKILPFLTSFFPNVQFIVSTHSPFILQSLKDTVIFDLETKKRFENFSDFSSETILETYYDVDKFSEVIKNDMKTYEEMLKSKNGKNGEDIMAMRERFFKIPDIEVSYWVKDMDIRYREKIKPLLSV